MPKKELTAERLREVLDYDPETGVFRWKKPTATWVKVGRIADNRHPKKGYVRIRLDGALYGAHRLAWLYVYGEWPNGRVDHRDTDPANNRIYNLRLATNAQNLSNRGPQKNNTSGYKGVFWAAHCGRWRARLGCDGRQHHLGYYTTPEEAHEAYCKASAKINGEFSRTK